ncbi:hypothetical protein [Bacillus sp. Marseille-P3661]|uniref:hypothetical protein n=1 Tax=Bacillus sp. Marseille-P3661 TaxID=1936234 RepID=UPI000C826261|nr:hypothetical protein [Bacillus sp. Marseille-P3661]
MQKHPQTVKLVIENLLTNEEDIIKVIAGEKTSVRRHGKYTEVGEILKLKGNHYKITAVYQQANQEMTIQGAMKEGYPSIEEYRSHVQSCHKITTLTWQPEKLFWVHEFEKVD